MTVEESKSNSSTVDAVEARGITICKAGLPILDDISLTLKEGVFAALIGPSGCGKTSLLRVLAHLDAPFNGTTLFWGEQPELRKGSVWLASSHFYPRVTYVPQTLALWPHLTIRENMLFAAGDSPRVCSKLENLATYLEMSTILDRRPRSVSQGQRQRCALVRALLLTPAILLLDEITAALDEDLARKVWKLLRTFVQDGGTILASTHGARLAAACDYSYRIRQHKIVLESQ
jgi:ABC-type multidrug transport system ATPase subunit